MSILEPPALAELPSFPVQPRNVAWPTSDYDHAGYTIARPLAHEPGSTFNYSSGTSNVVARIVCDLIGEGEQATAWMCEHLFGPVGMVSATPTYDTRGTFVGSSYLHMTARDWARFGLLHLRGAPRQDRGG